MGKAQVHITMFVFCAITENIVSQGSFQHPDGQKAVSKPQVRGQTRQMLTPTSSNASNASGFFHLPRFLSHVQTPSSAWPQLSLPQCNLFLAIPNPSGGKEGRVLVSVQSCQPVSMGGGVAGLSLVLASEISDTSLTVPPHTHHALPCHGRL